MLPSFRAALDADQAAALHTRSAVIVALEARRRAHDDALRACLDRAGIDDLIAIAFDVDVRSRGDALEIGDATFGDVVEGPPLEPSVAACLEPLLAGSSTVPAGDGGAFLVGYDGPIDYVARFGFAPRAILEVDDDATIETHGMSALALPSQFDPGRRDADDRAVLAPDR